MDMIHATWGFKRIPFLQVLEVIGETTEIKGVDILMSCAMEFIDLAQEFNGRLLPEEPSVKSKSPLAIYFSLVFPTETDLERFAAIINWH